MKSYIYQFSSCLQKDNVANQREHIILLLASAQSRLGTLDQSREGDTDKVLFFKICSLPRVLLWSIDHYHVSKMYG